MDDGTHPTPTNRPTNRPIIRSASDEAAAGNDAPNGAGIRSASEEHTAKPTRELGQQPRPWPPRLSGASGNQGFPETVRTAGQKFDRALKDSLDEGGGRATALGGALMAGYGTAISEAVSYMGQAVERQNELLGSMLQARGPQDIITAGQRYLLGGWLAFFEVNVRVAQAASRLSQDSAHSPPRPGA
ncbi:hypothetical protein A6A40_16020 (plasmid) [Azospirillum humicireducens]|uniref:Phasin domain-containing protein n=1 Tax=Azospirillum humicireducens TaxID=1226968 RepID=A0A2R4VQ90_9PROT|nr:hypothetical protein [Azospirillum humicireducens]AWB06591.1 hypothetical protein A6A40_16020 [Azospirillum humicireducens]